MKIQVTEMVKKEVEIITPCYVKSAGGYYVYHVIDKHKAIQVYKGIMGDAINSVSAYVAFSDKFSIIKATEYKEVFNNVLKALSL